MSYSLIDAVYASRIEPRLRFLASVLARYGDDDGTNVRPGISLLTQALGISESGVREGLQALVNSQVLVRDGYHGHTRRFRFDLERLASYRPAAVSRAAWRATLKPEPCALAHGSNGKPNRTTLRHGEGFRVHNPTPRRTEPYATAYPTLRHGGANPTPWRTAYKE